MDKVKVLIAQSGSIEYVMRDYYERYKDDGIILIPEDEPVALTENIEIHMHKEPMVSMEDLKVELPNTPTEVHDMPEIQEETPEIKEETPEIPTEIPIETPKIPTEILKKPKSRRRRTA